MPFRYHENVNIYDTEAMARYIRAQETQFTVLQGKISALITDSELEILRNGGSTMYSRMTSVEATAEGLTSQVSTLQTNLTNNYSTTEAMTSAINQKANEITTSVSNTLRNYSTTSQMNTAIQQSANSITQTASQTYATKSALNTLESRVGTAESKITPTAIINTVTSSSGATAMVSSINQSADTVKIQAAHIDLVGAVTADCIATGAVNADKIDVDDLFAQDITATGTISGVTISGGTITGGSISGGSINGATVTGGSISGATVTGGTISGTNCNIQEGNIGNWAIRNGALVDDATGSYLTGNWIFEKQYQVESLYSDMYGQNTSGQPVLNAKIPRLTSRVSDLETTTSGHTASIADHETRIGNLESAPLPANISCTTLTATGALSGDSLSVTHGITGVEIDLTGHVNAGNITGAELYTQTSNAGTGSNAVITGTGRIAPTSASSRRYKKDMGLVNVSQAREVLNVPVVNFQYKSGYLAEGDEKEGVTIPGFFAEDVERCIPEAVYHNKDGKVENWMERIMLPLMLRVIQDQQHRIEELERKR